MGNRMMKDTIRTSKSVNAMTDFQFRIWVYLITYVDDYGRGSADPELLKGLVFTRRKRLTEKDIAKVLLQLQEMGCILLYEVDGESYFCFPKWNNHQRVQTKYSRFPAPRTETQGADVGSAASRPERAPEAVACEQVPEEFSGQLRDKLREWLQYKTERGEAYRPTGMKNFIAEVKKHRGARSDEQLCALIGECMANGWKGIVWAKLAGEGAKQNKSAQTAGTSIDMAALDAYIDGSMRD